MSAGRVRVRGQRPFATWSTLRAPLGLAVGLLLLLGAAGPEDGVSLGDPVAQDPVPPRVLLLGDTTLGGHFRNAAQALKEEAEVVTSPRGTCTRERSWRAWRRSSESSLGTWSR